MSGLQEITFITGLIDLRKSGNKWPKFKEIDIQKIKLAKVVAKEKKILARTLLCIPVSNTDPFYAYQCQILTLSMHTNVKY